MRHLIIMAAMVAAAYSVSAQGYKQAAGIRASWISPGFEYRYYTSDEHSLRGLLSFRNRGVQLCALTEFHTYDLFSFSDQIVFFYGAGLHAGFESWDEIIEVDERRLVDTRTSAIAGIDGVIGLEYVFYEAPVKLGLEVKPYLDLFGHEDININLYDFAFTVKYLF